jgi:hypothetical protein
MKSTNGRMTSVEMNDRLSQSSQNADAVQPIRSVNEDTSRSVLDRSPPGDPKRLDHRPRGLVSSRQLCDLLVHAHDAPRRCRTDRRRGWSDEHGGDDLKNGDDVVAGEGGAVDEEAEVEGVKVEDGGGEFGCVWSELSDGQEFS